MQTKDKLFYDGSCPLCAKEIVLMRKHTNNQLEFVDIHQQLLDVGLPNKKQLLRRLHLQLANGEWLIGLDANVYAWSFNPYGKILRILRWPIIKPIIDFIYTNWADKRYRKRYQCNSCNLPTFK